jgi:hypothetical protein
MNKTYLAVSKAYKLEAVKETLKLPGKPSYNNPEQCMEVYAGVRRQLDKLDIMGSPLSAENLSALVRIARGATGCGPEIARGLLQTFHKCLMDKRTIDIIGWQIAGNRKRLKDVDVQLYTGKSEERGWMHGAVAECLQDSNSKTGMCYRIRILDGPAAGMDMYMPTPKHIRLLSDVLGATYKVDKERIKITDPNQAVQFRLLVYPEAGSIVNFTPHVGHTELQELTKVNSVGVIKASAKQKQYNQSLTKTRKEVCPLGYFHPCHICPVGYDTCYRSCISRSKASSDSITQLTIKGTNLCQKTFLED